MIKRSNLHIILATILFGISEIIFAQERQVTENTPIAEVSSEDSHVHTPHYLSLKTNLLFDAAAIPNIGIEVPFLKRWSVTANWHCAWWKKTSGNTYWQTYGGDLSIRLWLPRGGVVTPLYGHHLGVYGQMYTYDFEFGHKGYQADKWSFGYGLEYGYSLVLSRRLNMDFSLGIGYFGGEYKEYEPQDGHYVWQATKYRHWFGPTKAEVSLVWVLGDSGYKKKKGGRP